MVMSHSSPPDCSNQKGTSATKKVKKLLPDYSVGGLSRRKRKFIKKHLDSCPECLRELGYLDKTATLLDSIPFEEPPDSPWESIRSQILQQEPPVKVSPWKESVEWLWGKRKQAFAMGMVILILVVGGAFILSELPIDSEATLNIKVEQYALTQWNDPFADTANLGLLVTQIDLEDGNHETLR